MGLFFGNICTDLLSISVAVVCIIYAYFKYSYSYWSRRGVFNFPPEIPFGNTKDMLLQRQSNGESIREMYIKFKLKGLRFGGYYVLSSPELILIDPDLIKAVMSKDFAYFSNRGMQVDDDREPILGHLLGLRGQKWRTMRQKLTPTFTSGKVKMMFQTILACADGLEEILDDYVKNKEDIDVKDVLGRFTTDIIGSCAFGLECNSLKDADAEFRRVGRKVFNTTKLGAIKRVLLRFVPNVFNFLKLKLIPEDITDFFMKVVADTIEYREKNNIKRNDFLQLLINMKNTGNVDEDISNGQVNGEGLNLGQIVAQCFVFFLAGFETSSTAMTFFLYDMCLHPDIQDKVRKEINDMLKRHDGKLTYDGIMELQYLEMALFESMRLHSAIPILDRRCTQDYRIPNSDVIIEKGTAVTISVYGLQSDPEYFPEPNKYNPERFSKEETAKRHAFTFLPFGEGPRVCIGQRFGLMQTKVGLVSLMRNHKYVLSERMQGPLKRDPRSTLVQIEGGIWMNAERV